MLLLEIETEIDKLYYNDPKEKEKLKLLLNKIEEYGSERYNEGYYDSKEDESSFND
jgi:hypothetical protein